MTQAPPTMPQPILVPRAAGGVRVSTPIMSNPTSTQAFPIMFNAMPAQPGYNAALQHFHELSDTLKNRAYNLDKGQSVVVKVKMMTHLPGRAKATIVSVSIMRAFCPCFWNAHITRGRISPTPLAVYQPTLASQTLRRFVLLLCIRGSSNGAKITP